MKVGLKRLVDDVPIANLSDSGRGEECGDGADRFEGGRWHVDGAG